MTRSLTKAALVGLSLLCGASVTPAQGKADFGKREYESDCAGCHGIRGKGDGPCNPYLDKSSSDLTMLANNDGGAFRYQRPCEVVRCND